jgi:beta-xylosidase
MSPTAYKKQLHGDTDASGEKNRIALQEAMYQRAREYLSETGVEERQVFRVQSSTVRVDGAKKLPYEKNWQAVINIGRAGDLLKSRVQEQVLFLRDKLGFRSVRFWGIFDEEMELRPGHERDFLNFDRLDEVLDFLVYNNLTPFIEMGAKPIIIAATTTDVILHNPGKPPFQELSEFKAVLEQLIHHCLTRYRAEQVRRWRFECWDDQRTYRQSQPVSYFDIFNLTSETIRAIVPEAVIGGCGMKINDSEMEDFLRSWMEQPCRPDFFSVYSYPYEESSERDVVGGDCRYTAQSMDSQFLRHHVERTRSLMDAVGMDVPLFVTEWNCTISSRNYINDTCYKGTYVLKNVAENLGKVEVLACREHFRWLSCQLHDHLQP